MFTTVNVLTHHPLLDVIMIDLLIPLVNSDYLDVDLEGNHKELSSYSPCFRVIPYRAGMPGRHVPSRYEKVTSLVAGLRKGVITV